MTYITEDDKKRAHELHEQFDIPLDVCYRVARYFTVLENRNPQRIKDLLEIFADPDRKLAVLQRALEIKDYILRHPFAFSLSVALEEESEGIVFTNDELGRL